MIFRKKKNDIKVEFDDRIVRQIEKAKQDYEVQHQSEVNLSGDQVNLRLVQANTKLARAKLHYLNYQARLRSAQATNWIQNDVIKGN